MRYVRPSFDTTLHIKIVLSATFKTVNSYDVTYYIKIILHFGAMFYKTIVLSYHTTFKIVTSHVATFYVMILLGYDTTFYK